MANKKLTTFKNNKGHTYSGEVPMKARDIDLLIAGYTDHEYKEITAEQHHNVVTITIEDKDGNVDQVLVAVEDRDNIKKASEKRKTMPDEKIAALYLRYKFRLMLLMRPLRNTRRGVNKWVTTNLERLGIK